MVRALKPKSLKKCSCCVWLLMSHLEKYLLSTEASDCRGPSGSCCSAAVLNATMQWFSSEIHVRKLQLHAQAVDPRFDFKLCPESLHTCSFYLHNFNLSQCLTFFWVDTTGQAFPSRRISAKNMFSVSVFATVELVFSKKRSSCTIIFLHTAVMSSQLSSSRLFLQ